MSLRIDKVVPGNIVFHDHPDTDIASFGTLDTRYLKLNQSTPQTLTASPIFNNLTAGRIPFASATKTLTDDSGLFWDNMNKRLALLARLQINDDSQLDSLGLYYSPTRYVNLSSSSGGNFNIRPYSSAMVVWQRDGSNFLQMSINSASSEADFVTNTGFNIRSSSNAEIKFQHGPGSSPKTRLVIKTNGDIGINTTTPSSKLHVNGDASGITSIFRANATTPGNLTEWQSSSGTILASISPTGSALFSDKVIFTQTDGNEYIDSLADGFMDYGATTLHRFNQSIDITGNCEADTYSVGGVAGIDKSITVLDADGTTTHALTFTKGILTACVTI